MKKILYAPHPILRQKALKLKTITKEDIKIAKEMFEIMVAAPGVGLAANQIGILKKIITINIPNEEKTSAENGDIDAQFLLAKILFNKGFIEDSERWFKSARRAGDKEAVKELKKIKEIKESEIDENYKY